MSVSTVPLAFWFYELIECKNNSSNYWKFLGYQKGAQWKMALETAICSWGAGGACIESQHQGPGWWLVLHGETARMVQVHRFPLSRRESGLWNNIRLRKSGEGWIVTTFPCMWGWSEWLGRFGGWRCWGLTCLTCGFNLSAATCKLWGFGQVLKTLYVEVLSSRSLLTLTFNFTASSNFLHKRIWLKITGL